MKAIDGGWRREAVVLAGGRGTRLSSILRDTPKPLANVAGRPFIRFILDHLHGQGFRRVILSVGYKSGRIKECLGNVYRGMELVYSSEDEPLLTGGAVKHALTCCKSPWVCVLNGDTFLDIDYSLLYWAAADSGSATQGVIAVRRMDDTGRYGTLEVDPSGRVEGFLEKCTQAGGLVNTGVYLLKKSALDGMPARFSLEEDYFATQVGDGILRAVECAGSFIDIGVPEDLQRAQFLMKPYVQRWKLALFDRDGTINEDVGHLFEPEKLVLLEETIDLVRRFNEDDRCKVIVVTNQAGIAKGLYGEAEMRRLHRAMDQCLAERGARIDAYYHCPHHPSYTGSCRCRKPMPGLIEKALSDFEADPSDCVMFGDKSTDAEAASAAGVPFEYIDRAVCRSGIHVAKKGIEE